MILSFFAYAFEIVTLYLVFVSLGFFVPPDKVIIVRSIAGNVEAQGYAFAGYAQILTTALYTALGIIPALAASVGILGGVVVFWLKTVNLLRGIPLYNLCRLRKLCVQHS